MGLFEEIRPSARVRGLDAAGVADIVQVTRFSADAVNLVFRVNGRVAERLLYRGEEGPLEVLESDRAYGFGADGALLKLASEVWLALVRIDSGFADRPVYLQRFLSPALL